MSNWKTATVVSDNSVQCSLRISDTSCLAFTAENGKIYCIPRISPYILVIDPITDTWIKFESPKGSDLTSIMFWNKGVLAGNGKIYGLPAYKNQDALEINPFDNTAKAFKVTDEVVTWYWSYCAVGSNGDVAGIPMNVDSVVKIDVPG